MITVLRRSFFIFSFVPALLFAQNPAISPTLTNRVFSEIQQARMDSIQIEQSTDAVNLNDPRERTRVLMIAAHPDDEDTQLIAWLARGRGVETAYLSLTRGEGGQNQISNDLGEALGVIRTNELLAARKIDGARQFFTRAYDFGFSKTTTDAFKHWPRDSIMDDVVRVVRSFRPHIIVSVFSGTPRDGHGQHQVAGILARAAYDSSADTVRFPVSKFGEPWTVLKFYRGAFFLPYYGTIRIDVSEYNPELQKTYADIAADSRAQHKSQGFDQIAERLRAESWDYLRLEASRVNPKSVPLEQTADTGAYHQYWLAYRERSMFDGLLSGYSYIPITMQNPIATLVADASTPIAAFPPPDKRGHKATPAQIRAMAVKVPTGMSIGYIEGVGDNVAPVLMEMGFAVSIIRAGDIPTTDLHKFTAIVIGTRAYQASENLVKNNKYLMEYLEWGGTLVVQYGQYEMEQEGILPYPIKVARPNARVTLEDAPVRILDKKSRLLSRPNKITANDWNGWVQERSLYMPSAIDPRYATVIQMNDPDEPANNNSILITKYGKGTYIYTTLSFFRQLPAGVSGAAKLFVNMLYAGQL